MEGAPPAAESGSPTGPHQGIARFGYDPNLPEDEPIPSPSVHSAKREGAFQRLLKKAHSIAKSVGPSSTSPASPASHHPTLHHAPPARPDPTYVQQTIDEREGEAEAEAMLRAEQRRQAAAAASGGEGFFWDGDGPRGSAAAMHKHRVLAMRRVQIAQQRSQSAQQGQAAQEGCAESTRPTRPSVVTGPAPPLTPPRQQRGAGKCPKDSDSICESPGNPLLTPHSYTSSAWSTNSSIDRPPNTQAPGSPSTLLRSSTGSDLRLPQQPQAQPQAQPQPSQVQQCLQQRRVLGANPKGNAWWARHSADPAFKTRLAATQVRMAGRASLGHGQAPVPQTAPRQGATVQVAQQPQQVQVQGARECPDDSSRNSTPSFGLSTLPTTATTSSGPGLTSMSNPLGSLDGNGMHGSPSFQSSLSDINGADGCSEGEEGGIEYIDALEFSHL